MRVKFRPVGEVRDIADKIFREQKQKILKLLPQSDIQHIGATIIPGSITKGDLDINVRVPQKDFHNACQKLEQLYSQDKNNRRTSTTASFKDENQQVPLGVQLTVIGSKYDKFVRQRNLLFDNPNLVEELNKLKREFEGKDMAKYRKAKAQFFQKLEKKIENSQVV